MLEGFAVISLRAVGELQLNSRLQRANAINAKGKGAAVRGIAFACGINGQQALRSGHNGDFGELAAISNSQNIIAGATGGTERACGANIEFRIGKRTLRRQRKERGKQAAKPGVAASVQHIRDKVPFNLCIPHKAVDRLCLGNDGML